MAEAKAGTPARTYRLRIDASKCDGQGVCKLVAPEWFALDRYGYAYTLPAAWAIDRSDPTLWKLAQEAEATCPRSAIRIEETSPPPDPAAVDATDGGARRAADAGRGAGSCGATASRRRSRAGVLPAGSSGARAALSSRSSARPACAVRAAPASLPLANGRHSVRTRRSSRTAPSASRAR